jgi:hypothetical protein
MLRAAGDYPHEPRFSTAGMVMRANGVVKNASPTIAHKLDPSCEEDR